jgi:hypothetical protein
VDQWSILGAGYAPQPCGYPSINDEWLWCGDQSPSFQFRSPPLTQAVSLGKLVGSAMSPTGTTINGSVMMSDGTFTNNNNINNNNRNDLVGVKIQP